MPTSRRRFSVTETDDVAHALDAAALVWPQDAANRAALLRRLIELTIMPVTGADALAIAELRAATRLPLVDALDVYAAQRYAARLATADRRLAHAAAARGIPTHLL